MNEIEQAIVRAYDALSDVVDIAAEMGAQDLLWDAERARDRVNALSAHPSVTTKEN